jgi:hypothetical protein
MMHARSVIGITLVALLAFAGATGAQETMKHSGSVVALDERAGKLVMNEVGPWQVSAGRTTLTTLTIDVTPETEFAIASRDVGPTGGSLGPYVVRPIAAWAIYTGDYVTVDCRHEGKRLIATAVTVTYIPSE